MPNDPYESVKACPYCGINFSLNGVDAHNAFPQFGRHTPFGGGSPSGRRKHDDGGSEETQYSITSHKCPSCNEPIMWLNNIIVRFGESASDRKITSTTLLFPKRPVKHVPAGIPSKFADDFREAYDTLQASPKASAALSRRCLQNLIREQEGIIEKTLFAEVDRLLKLRKLPQYLADDLDAIRNVGNFAAHPVKDLNTGEIVNVEPGEAEWTLQVLEGLLMFYFVELPQSRARRDALNQKLKGTGKGPML
jgi:hypothetical protein